MRDIGTRLRRYRLSRYAPPTDPLRRGLRWGWVALALWLIWIGALSDHSLWRIWSLSRENAQAEQELQSTRASVERLDAELTNPDSQREQAERALRERTGMARPGEIVYRIRGGARADSGGH
ncbi:MAG: septum formation initiator family protein [Candidatus Eisenbacteria bacterium]